MSFFSIDNNFVYSEYGSLSAGKKMTQRSYSSNRLGNRSSKSNYSNISIVKVFQKYNLYPTTKFFYTALTTGTDAYTFDNGISCPLENIIIDGYLYIGLEKKLYENVDNGVYTRCGALVHFIGFTKVALISLTTLPMTTDNLDDSLLCQLFNFCFLGIRVTKQVDPQTSQESSAFHLVNNPFIVYYGVSKYLFGSWLLSVCIDITNGDLYYGLTQLEGGLFDINSRASFGLCYEFKDCCKFDIALLIGIRSIFKAVQQAMSSTSTQLHRFGTLGLSMSIVQI